MTDHSPDHAKRAREVLAGHLGMGTQWLTGHVQLEASAVTTAMLAYADERVAAALRGRDAVVEALRWALPLAERAMEDHRLERIRCGHSDIHGTYKNGVTWSGIWQAEVDQIEVARAALDDTVRGEGEK